MNKGFIIILIALSYLVTEGQAPDPSFINIKSAGGLIELGVPYYAIQEGDRYTPLLIGGTYEIPVYQTKNKFNVAFSFHPLLGMVFLKETTAFEFGFNIRFHLNLAISRQSILRGTLGIGPHFMDHHTRRQAYGWLLADYFLISYRRYFPVRNRYCNVELKAGYRHISNSNVWNPNGGISNFIFGVGMNVLIGPLGLKQ